SFAAEGILTSDVAMHSISHHADNARYRRSYSARGEGHPREGRPIDWGGCVRAPCRGACPSPSVARSATVPLDLSPYEVSGRSDGQGGCPRGPRCGPAVSYSLDVNVLL